MTLEDAFRSIESLEYTVGINIASNLSSLKSMVRETVAYNTLRECMEMDAISEDFIRDRCASICYEPNSQYENELDIAYFFYILALHDQTRDVWKECGRMVVTPRLWWTKKLINELMNPKLF